MLMESRSSSGGISPSGSSDQAGGERRRLPTITFGQLAAPTTAATAYTVPANDQATIETVAFTNTTGAGLTVTLNVVKAGQSAQSSNQLYSGQLIPANNMAFDLINCVSIPAGRPAARTRHF
jgi:hypothetical protein